MKKTVLLIALLAIIFCSCDDRQYDGKRTERGKDIAETWQNITNVIVTEVVNETFHLNAWINADDSLRRIIENQYFTSSRVRIDGENLYGIYTNTGTLLMTVNTNGASLSDADANWEIHHITMQNYAVSSCIFSKNQEVIYNLSNLGNNSWHLSMDSTTAEGTTLDLTVSVPGETLPYDIMVQRFTLEGNGSYEMYANTIYTEDTRDNTPITLQFNVETALCNNVSTDINSWDSGKVNLKAKWQNFDDINVVVEYFSDVMRITYRGITEEWDNAQ